MSEFAPSEPQPLPPPQPVPTGEGAPVPPEEEHMNQRPEEGFEAEAARRYPDAPRITRAIYNAFAEDVNRKDTVTARELAADTDIQEELAEAVFKGMKVRGLVSKTPNKDGSFSVIHPPEKPTEPKPPIPERVRNRRGWAAEQIKRQFTEYRAASWIGKNVLLGEGTEPYRTPRKPEKDPEKEGTPNQPPYMEYVDLATTDPGIVILASPPVYKKFGVLTKYGYSHDPKNAAEAPPLNAVEARAAREDREEKARKMREAKREQEARDQLKPDMWEEVLGFVAGKGRPGEDAGKAHKNMTPAMLTVYLAKKSGRINQLAAEAGLDINDPENMSDEDRTKYIELSRKARDEARPFANMYFNRLLQEGVVSDTHDVVMGRKQIKAIRRAHREERAQKAVAAAHEAWEAKLANNAGVLREAIRAGLREDEQRQARSQTPRSPATPRPASGRPEWQRQPQLDHVKEVLEYMIQLYGKDAGEEGKSRTMAEESIVGFLVRKYGLVGRKAWEAGFDLQGINNLTGDERAQAEARKLEFEKEAREDTAVRRAAAETFRTLVDRGIIKPEFVDKDGKSVSVDRVTKTPEQLKQSLKKYVDEKAAQQTGGK